MNRADLSWALNAVLPHCGRTEQTDWVGIQHLQGASYVYATDNYTIGVARITDAANVNERLSRSEATELMRFARPGTKAEQAQELSFGRRPGELHVGYDDDSAVFDTLEPEVSATLLIDVIRRVYAATNDWREAIYQPKMIERFAKAQRTETDRLRIFPRRPIDRNGVAVVTVGPDFIGAITGLAYDEVGADDMVNDLLTEMRVA